MAIKRNVWVEVGAVVLYIICGSGRNVVRLSMHYIGRSISHIVIKLYITYYNYLNIINYNHLHIGNCVLVKYQYSTHICEMCGRRISQQ